jgi:hypothetical protein
MGRQAFAPASPSFAQPRYLDGRQRRSRWSSSRCPSGGLAWGHARSGTGAGVDNVRRDDRLERGVTKFGFSFLSNVTPKNAIATNAELVSTAQQGSTGGRHVGCIKAPSSPWKRREAPWSQCAAGDAKDPSGGWLGDLVGLKNLGPGGVQGEPPGRLGREARMAVQQLHHRQLR